MFSLIVVLVAIVVSSAMVFAAIYYGGGSFIAKQKDVDAQRLANQATQLRTAVQLYQQDTGVPPANITQLVTDQYLTADFSAGTWAVTDPYFTNSTVTDDLCTTFNKKLNIEGIPACSDPAVAGIMVCCSQ